MNINNVSMIFISNKYVKEIIEFIALTCVCKYCKLFCAKCHKVQLLYCFSEIFCCQVKFKLNFRFETSCQTQC